MFFDDVAPELRLEVCFGKNPLALGPWQNALTPIRRSLKNLIINSHGNYLHACHNHLNHFNADISDLEEGQTDLVVDLTTYQITKDLARFQIEEQGLASRPFHFQFRLVVVPDVVLTSPIYENP